MSGQATASPGGGLVDRAQNDPGAFVAEVAGLLEQHADDMLALVHVRWGLGLARRELGELPAARDELHAAADAAERHGAIQTAALIRSSLAVVLLHLGNADAALAQTEIAATALDGVDAARNDMQRGLVLQRLGRQAEAIAAYEQAAPALAAADDHAGLGRLLSNRGVLYAYRGALDAAWRDLERAVELARAAGGGRPLALRLHNLGFVAGRQGQLPEALAFLADADDLLRELGDTAALAVLETDRAELLADSGLIEEAVGRAEAAAALLADDAIRGGEAQLLLARLLLLAGHDHRAAAIADELVGRFRDAGRTGWELHARYLTIAARAGSGGEVDLDEVARLADDLREGGWTAEARATRLLAARTALRQGAAEQAIALLDQVRGASRRAPALQRAQHWYATALASVATGERQAARRAVTAGLDALERSRLAFGSAELRAHAATHTVDLVELAVRLALEQNRPADALRAVDRVRSTEVAVRVNPPDDPQLAADLAELRQITEQEREAARSGEDVNPLVDARAAVEQRLRERSRALGTAGDLAGVGARDGDAANLEGASDGTAGGDGSGGDTTEPQPQVTAGLRADVTARLRLDVAAVRKMLAGRTLMSYLHLDGCLHAIELTGRTTRHHVLGSADQVRTEVAHLRAAVRRLAHARGSAAALAAAESSLQRSVGHLWHLLGLDQVDPDGVVVVPTRMLDGLPWSAFFRTTGAIPTVAPSAQAWLAAAQRPTRRESVLLAAGPDLPGADEEVLALVGQRPDSLVLRGAAASTAAVLDALRSADVAHLAAHGRFRADNPLFSSLRFADGLLTVYELEHLDQVPDLFVLPSCEAAATATVRGDAVLGLSSTLLRLGARTVVAPVVEIPDEATCQAMVHLHARLDGGAAVQDALRDVVSDAVDDTPAARAVRSAFVVAGC